MKHPASKKGGMSHKKGGQHPKQKPQIGKTKKKLVKGRVAPPRPKQQKQSAEVVEERDDFEVHGEYDFSSDDEVMDLSAMLDDPKERVVRKGGKNKHLQPKIPQKPKKGDDEGDNEDDDEIDSGSFDIEFDFINDDDDTTLSIDPSKFKKTSSKPTVSHQDIISSDDDDDGGSDDEHGVLDGDFGDLDSD